MAPSEIPPITPQLWLANILDVAESFADGKNQESRWLASDNLAWERPEELINSLDDVVLDGFISKFDGSFSEQQRRTIHDFQREVDMFCGSTPQWLDPAQTLADPRWRSIQEKALALVTAFKGRWPAEL
jgi:hypothetical protein